MTAIDTPPPDMTSSEGRVANMRNWVDQLEVDIARIAAERDALWQAIAVLDPDALMSNYHPPAKVWPTPSEVGAKIDAASMPRESPTPKVKKAAAKATKPRVKRKDDPPAKRSNKSRPPLEEIAVVYNKAKDAGGSTSAAMAAHFGVPVTTTNNWPAALRKAGLIDAKVRQITSAKTARAATLMVVEDNTGHTDSDAVYVAEQVAEEYLEAIRTNRRPMQAVADRFEIDRPTAIAWVRQARLDGALPASSTEPQLPEAERREILDSYKPEPAG